MSTLAELQRAMRTALHAQRPEALSVHLVADAVAPEARVEVYRGMYWARQVDALAEDYPTLLRRLGRPFFERLAATHILRRPSSEPSLAGLGRDLEGTLDGLGLVVEQHVARLEWARAEAFWAPDARAWTRAELVGLGDGLGSAVLVFHPSLRLVKIRLGARDAVAGGEGSALGGEDEESVAVWRRDEQIQVAPVATAEAEALRLALAGASVEVAFEAFAEEEAPEQAALAALMAWIEDQWIVDATAPG